MNSRNTMKINPVNSRLGRLVRRNPSLPRVLALVLLVVATAVWASGALHWSAKPPARLVPTTKVNTPPPPPQPQPHFWESYLGPGRLRGSEERNRTQIGIEKASLVMLVR